MGAHGGQLLPKPMLVALSAPHGRGAALWNRSVWGPGPLPPLGAPLFLCQRSGPPERFRCVLFSARSLTLNLLRNIIDWFRGPFCRSKGHLLRRRGPPWLRRPSPWGFLSLPPTPWLCCKQWRRGGGVNVCMRQLKRTSMCLYRSMDSYGMLHNLENMVKLLRSSPSPY